MSTLAKILQFPHDTSTPLREIWWGDKPQWKAQFEIEPGNAYECPHTHWEKAEALRCHRRLVRFMNGNQRRQQKKKRTRPVRVLPK